MTDHSRPTGVDKPAQAADPPPGGRPAAAGAKNASPGSDRVVIRDKRKVRIATKPAEAEKPTPEPADADAPATDAPATDSPAAAAPAAAAPAAGAPVTEAAQPPAGTEEQAGTAPDTVPAQPLTEVDPAPADVETPFALGAELESMRSEIEERTKDLQRLSAEYANYRKRVDRDRTLVVEQATGHVLGALLPVLDDVDRARDHDDLVGPFAAVAEQLVNALTKFGLTAFGAKGDPFDPTRHEAVAHLTSTEVTEPTCVEVMRRGYLLGERLLRPALVAVADPVEPEQQ